MSKISELSDGTPLVSSDYLIAVRSGGNVKVRLTSLNIDQVTLGDNEMIRLGNSQDLTLVHTSTQSIINQAGVGDLLIQKGGTTKLTVNSSGIDVTGTVTASSTLTAQKLVSTNGVLELDDNGSHNGIINSPASLFINIDSDNGSTGEDFVIGKDRTSTSGGTELFRVQEDGNVGIGCTPASKLDIDISTDARGSFSSGIGEVGSGNFALQVTNSAGSALKPLGFRAEDIRFATGSSERFRVDTSGNLLVSKTASDGSVAGHELRAGSFAIHTRDNGPALYARRIGSGTNDDGPIQVFENADGQVGSIGAHSSSLQIGTSNTQIRFADAEDSFYVVNSAGVARDNSHDLGKNGARFKDLHLSGVSYNGDGSATAPSISFGADDNTGFYRVGSDQIGFVTAGTIKAKLDASGNLLVGKTASNYATEGVEIRSNEVLITKAGLNPLSVRSSGNGSILSLNTDGTEVGNIGTLSSKIYVGSDDTGLFFDSLRDALVAHNPSTNASRGSAISLGRDIVPFNNLYLSGTANIGSIQQTVSSTQLAASIENTNTAGYGMRITTYATGSEYAFAVDSYGGGYSRDFTIGADGNVNVLTGNLTVAGSISKGSGSFKIDHPLPEKSDTHHLVHSFVESPQADNIYRGKVDLVDGSATVNIDDAAGMTEGTYVLLNTNTQCFTSNESGWTAVKGSVSGNILTITAQESCSDTISWLVVGERHDQHMLDTEWTDENGKVIVEPLKASQGNAL